MKTREKIELGLIPVLVASVRLSAPALPTELGMGELLVIACLAWLVQGGLRDLWLLYLGKSHPTPEPRRRLACMCLESSVGLTGVMLGVVLALSGLGARVALTANRWMLLAAAVLTLGFVAKDFVITWRPLGLRRDPDHHTIILAWWA